MFNEGVGKNGYHKTWYSSRDWRSYRNILSLVIAHSEPGPILDVGAGCGFIVEGAVRWGISCKGIDGSAEAVAIARERYPEMDIRQHLLSDPMPFSDQSFQTVIINQVIEHLEPEVARRVLKETCRVLRPGGMLAVTSPCKYNKYEKEVDPTHINLYSPGELSDLLVECGFAKVIPINSALHLLGGNRLAAYIMNTLWKMTKWDRWSATANALAYKSKGLTEL